MNHPVRFLGEVVASASVVITLLALSAPSNDAPSPTRPPASGSVGWTDAHAQMQRDIDMTLQMALPNASGPMQNGQVTDGQLLRSQDPAYIGRLSSTRRTSTVCSPSSRSLTR